MALTKEVVYDKVEVVGEYKTIQCREATIVSEDGVELSRSYNRHFLNPSTCVKNEDGSFTHVDTDISDEPQETQDICAAVWTSAVKAAWKTYGEESLTQDD